MGTPPPIKQELMLCGGAGISISSARAGFLPICLDRLPLPALNNIDLHVRINGREGAAESFTLFRGGAIPFTEQHRLRLVNAGIKFVYIPIVQQALFRRQTEDCLLQLVGDAGMAVSVRAEIIYETSVELVNELLSEPDLVSQSPRLQQVARAVTMLVLNDPTSFSHLFAASHHDFYTATHMVNVGTWMVPLAYAMGIHDIEELSHICQAGMMHDIGKTCVPAFILNKRSKLSMSEWGQIRQHPELGYQHLSKYDGIHPLVRTVTLEHHERMDGSGYPKHLRGEQIHLASRICAVVDSFDAMTAFRPFKQHTMSVDQAMEAITSETPLKYDARAVAAWMELLHSAQRLSCPAPANHRGNHPGRSFERFRINCPARLHVLEDGPQGWREKPGLQAEVHNISRSGLGLLSQTKVEPGERARIFLLGESSLKQSSEGIVVRCREYGDGWYELGLKYASLAAEGDTECITALTTVP